MARAIKLIALLCVSQFVYGEDPVKKTDDEKAKIEQLPLIVVARDLSDGKQERERLNLLLIQLRAYSTSLDGTAAALSVNLAADATEAKDNFSELRRLANEIRDLKKDAVNVDKEKNRRETYRMKSQSLVDSLEGALMHAKNIDISVAQSIVSLGFQVEALHSLAQNSSSSGFAGIAVGVPGNATQLPQQFGSPFVSSQSKTPSSEIRYPLTRQFFPNIGRIFISVFSVPWVANEFPIPSDDVFVSAAAELENLPKTLDAASNRAKHSDKFQAIKKSIDESINSVTTRLDKSVTRLDYLEERLQKGDANNTQLNLNYRLTYAVFGMIFIIGMVFVILTSIKDTSIVKSLIKERLLIEVLSMGFLLLTVIILGTGKLIKEEGLAALLGTIAGYIFGQKVAAMAQRGGGDRSDPAPVPAAEFSLSPATGTAPLKVSFTDASTGKPTAWNWNFGDGSAADTQQNPTHTYAAKGTYTVTLTVTNPTGTKTMTKKDCVTVT